MCSESLDSVGVVESTLGLNRAEARIEELRSKLVATAERVDASNELVRVVEEEQSIQKRRAEAGILTRTKWWITGMPGKNE